MGQTPHRGYRFPDPTGFVALGADNIRQLAEDIEADQESRQAFGAAGLRTYQGTPSFANHNVSSAYWLLDAAAIEAVGASFIVPRGWATAHIDAYWVNAGAGEGDVVLRRYASGTEVEQVMNSAAGPDVTTRAAAQNVLKRTRLDTMVVVPGALFSLAVSRNAPAAADTLPNDIGVVMLHVLRAS